MYIQNHSMLIQSTILHSLDHFVYSISISIYIYIHQNCIYNSLTKYNMVELATIYIFFFFFCDVYKAFQTVGKLVSQHNVTYYI